MDLSPDRYKEVSRAWLFAARGSWDLPVLSRGLLYVVQNARARRNHSTAVVLRHEGLTSSPRCDAARCRVRAHNVGWDLTTR
jgi:hypothetical protein